MVGWGEKEKLGEDKKRKEKVITNSLHAHHSISMVMLIGQPAQPISELQVQPEPLSQKQGKEQ